MGPDTEVIRPFDQVELLVEGTWGTASDSDVSAVLLSALDCCLAGVEARVVDLPRRIIVVGCPNRPYPQCVATDARRNEAVVILVVVGPFWAQLAYQFAHELGHVVANNWGPMLLKKSV